MGSRKQQHRRRTTPVTPFSHPSSVVPVALRKLQKQQQEEQQAGLNNNNAAASGTGESERDEQNHTTPKNTIPTCLTKLSSPDPTVREEGCLDITRFAADAKYFHVLRKHGVGTALLDTLSGKNKQQQKRHVGSKTAVEGEEEENGATAVVTTGDGEGGVHPRDHDNHNSAEYVPIRAAAAAALRHVLIYAEQHHTSDDDDEEQDHHEKETFDANGNPLSFSQRLVQRHNAAHVVLQALTELWEARRVALDQFLSSASSNSLANPVTGQDEEEHVESITLSPLETLDDTHHALEEILTLCSVLIEGNDAIATTAFCDVSFLRVILEAIWNTEFLLSNSSSHATPSTSTTSTTSATTTTTGTATQKKYSTALDSFFPVVFAAAECLFNISLDNVAFQQWMATAHTTVPVELLQCVNAWTTPANWILLPQQQQQQQQEQHQQQEISGAAAAEKRRFLTPALTRIVVLLAGALYRGSPTDVATAERVLPFFYAALNNVAASPGAEWRRVLPYLRESSSSTTSTSSSSDITKLVLQQANDKLFAAQTSLSLIHALLGVLCENQRSDVEDHIAFSQNPLRYLLTECPITSSSSSSVGALPSTCALIIQMTRSVLTQLVDQTGGSSNARALREATVNPDATQLQHLFLSVEVVLLSVANNLLLLLPSVEESFGRGHPMQVVWRGVMEGLRDRVELLHAEPDAMRITTESATAMYRMQLCVESLAEMSWTLLRRDQFAQDEADNNNHNQKRHHHPNTNVGRRTMITPDPRDWDSLTSLAWSSRVTGVTKTFVVGAVSCMGSTGTRIAASAHNDDEATRTHHHNAMANASRFCVGVLSRLQRTHQQQQQQQGPEGGGEEDDFGMDDENCDLASQAADALMDLFSDETFDATLYVPLRVHEAMLFAKKLLHQYLTDHNFYATTGTVQQQRKKSKKGAAKRKKSSGGGVAEDVEHERRATKRTANMKCSVGEGGEEDEEATWAQVESVAEVYENIVRFLVYKKQNCPGL